MIRALVLISALCAAGIAEAKAPESSLRPQARPGSVHTQVAVIPATPQTGLKRSLRPRSRPVVNAIAVAVAQAQAARPAATQRPVARPRDLTTRGVVQSDPQTEARDERGHLTGQAAGATEVAAGQSAAQKERGGLFKSLRPLLRPRAVGQKAIARQNALARGSVCGDPAIQGTEVGAVRGTLNGCGVIKAVKVHEVSGIALSQHAVIDCVTAKALKSWINNGMKPAVGSYGGGVSKIRVVAHYACRTRNNLPGAKISEHGRGRAIDIAGFTMRDGSEISLLKDWSTAKKGRILRSMHKSACGPFGTVLGPESNRFHRDHFHFDTARYRSGSYCR